MHARLVIAVLVVALVAGAAAAQTPGGSPVPPTPGPPQPGQAPGEPLPQAPGQAAEPAPQEEIWVPLLAVAAMLVFFGVVGLVVRMWPRQASR